MSGYEIPGRLTDPQELGEGFHCALDMVGFAALTSIQHQFNIGLEAQVSERTRIACELLGRGEELRIGRSLQKAGKRLRTTLTNFRRLPLLRLRMPHARQPLQTNQPKLLAASRPEGTEKGRPVRHGGARHSTPPTPAWIRPQQAVTAVPTGAHDGIKEGLGRRQRPCRAKDRRPLLLFSRPRLLSSSVRAALPKSVSR
jgi:hypothetical protein